MPEGTPPNATGTPDTLNPSLDVYNELREGATVSIRYSRADFHCKSRPAAGSDPVYNPFYPELTGFPNSPDGFALGDTPQPTPEFLFFGDGTTLFHIVYDNMCGCPHDDQPNGNLHNHTEVTTLATSEVPIRPGQIDIFPGEVGMLYFRYVSPGYAPPLVPPSPFLFDGHLSGTPYFHCSMLNYRVILTVPRYGASMPRYCVQEANYYPNPNAATIFYT